ncbi:mediator of RNA polymerase II transcription subunit 16 [Galendromus occidentalis]|uniref:Mediator of RNA polymerase II transcription subunit 16 n=1 Tax=Galendromus occidentalis TaxID=34638 RepID=A0AAJ6QTC7_9ACAR|nr:mediator of RNA polymerase II transcription subunit 16 [Galendromus occidentalis]
MEQVYSVFRKASVFPNAEWRERVLKCSVSSRNTLAFTADSLDGPGRLSSFRVYVVDLNTPWQPSFVVSHTEEITCIEWDPSGTRLMIADATGTILMFQMRNFLLNDWTLISRTEFPGEHIIAGAWFHSGKKVAVHPDKKESPLYLEKYAHLKFGPSMRRMGGKPCEGCLTVSASGLVCVVVICGEESVVSASQPLTKFRHRLQLVDLCYGKNGDFLVVTSDGLVQSAVHFFRINLKMNQDKCEVSCQPFSSLYLDSQKEEAYQRVTHLRFILKEAADGVVVSVTNGQQGIVELWELREKTVSVHPKLGEADNKLTVGWQLHAISTHSSAVTAMATPRLCLFELSPPPSYILIAFKDHTVKCFARDKLACIQSIPTLSSPHAVKNQQHAQMGDMCLSHTGCVLITVDSLSQISLYRLSPITEPGAPMSAAYAATVLEYCLITGVDWWDVLISLRPGLIEKVSEKLCEVFEKQPEGVQQFFHSRFLALKGSLYRLLITGFVKAGDCHAQMMLAAVSCVIKGLLRPRETKPEGAPTDTLSSLINDRAQVTNTIERALTTLDTKEFFVEPAILPSVQHHVQWVTDLALHLMASFPLQVYQHQRFPGGGLISDAKSINAIRELLVIFRIWGLISESCLPVYTKMAENCDVLGTLFRLLTKTLMNHGSEPDSSLLEDCSVLPSQILIPSLDLGSTSPEGICGPALFVQPLPLALEFHAFPDYVRSHNHKSADTVEGCVRTSSHTDIVRHISLGKHVEKVRKCTRCFSLSMLRSSVKLSAMRAWEQRWLRSCPCGGQWVLC